MKQESLCIEHRMLGLIHDIMKPNPIVATQKERTMLKLQPKSQPESF